MKVYKVLTQFDCEHRFYEGVGREIGHFRQREDAIKFAEQYALTSDDCFPSKYWDDEKSKVYESLSQKMRFDGAYRRVEIKESNINAEKFLKLFTLEELEKEIEIRKTYNQPNV